MYRGRFAPSPTGPLHFGSLVAAVGSFLEARTHQGEWLVRMEDLDSPREQPGAADDILRALESHGFEWDGAVLYQSRRSGAYEDTLARLRSLKMLYPCACTRREIADSALRGIEGPIYPGTCREGLGGREPRAWRVRTDLNEVDFDDMIQGHLSQVLERDIGDFVLKRADGLYAYQLAVVVDDADQGISHIVRGADLLDSTPRQIYLQKLLNLPQPQYAHMPLAVNSQGEKLSKQTLAAPLDNTQPVKALWQTLTFLRQHPPAELIEASLQDIWSWAYAHWNLSDIPRIRALPAPETP